MIRNIPPRTTPRTSPKVYPVSPDSLFRFAEERPFLPGELSGPRTTFRTGIRIKRLHTGLTERCGTPYSKSTSRRIFDPTVLTDPNPLLTRGNSSIWDQVSKITGKVQDFPIPEVHWRLLDGSYIKKQVDRSWGSIRSLWMLLPTN